MSNNEYYYYYLIVVDRRSTMGAAGGRLPPNWVSPRLSDSDNLGDTLKLQPYIASQPHCHSSHKSQGAKIDRTLVKILISCWCHFEKWWRHTRWEASKITCTISSYHHGGRPSRSRHQYYTSPCQVASRCSHFFPPKSTSQFFHW